MRIEIAFMRCHRASQIHHHGLCGHSMCSYAGVETGQHAPDDAGKVARLAGEVSFQSRLLGQSEGGMLVPAGLARIYETSALVCFLRSPSMQGRI
jgi:hypothetical protein